jgi:hypothetical protein
MLTGTLISLTPENNRAVLPTDSKIPQVLTINVTLIYVLLRAFQFLWEETYITPFYKIRGITQFVINVTRKTRKCNEDNIQLQFITMWNNEDECSVLFWDIVLLCVTVFLLCIVLFIVLVLYCVCLWCTCCYPNWGFSVLFPQLEGKCQGITRTDGTRPSLPKLVNLLLLCLFRSLYSVYCLCVNVYRTAATGCQPNCG